MEPLDAIHWITTIASGLRLRQVREAFTEPRHAASVWRYFLRFILPAAMTVSYENSKIIFDGIKAAGIKSLSALPETWLGLLLQRAEDDSEIELFQVAKEEEAIGIAAGAYFAGTPHVLLMQNHGFFGAINGIVSLAQLYHVPLCMLIAYRGHWGEPYPWHTRGGIVTEEVLRALGIPYEYARSPERVAKQIREAWVFSQSSLSPVALLLTRDLMEV